jgi:protocatechuate 3,4-dioxygenase beta subunit
MDNDDQQIGRILSRRELLALVGAGAVALAGCAAPSTGTTASGSASTAASSSATASQTLTGEASEAAIPSVQATFEAEVETAEAINTQVATPNCVVRPEVTEGPYYVDVDLIRSDIRTDNASGTAQDGTPLTLTFNVSEVSDSGCVPFEGVTVEVWHCNAAGAYSGVSDPGFDTTGQTWLRGAQVTDANGVATFTTIYPGWYSSRSVHIHFKVSPAENQVFTSQLFFDDALSEQVFSEGAYTVKAATPDTLNSADSIYQDLLLLTTEQSGDGYAAAFPIGIDVSTIGSGQTGGGGPGGAPGGTPPSGGPGGPRPSSSATTTP